MMTIPSMGDVRPHGCCRNFSLDKDNYTLGITSSYTEGKRSGKDGVLVATYAYGHV